MDRSLLWSQNQSRTYDYERQSHDTMVALATTMQDALGSTSTVVSGLAAAQTISPSLTINIGAGAIYQLADADAVADGSIPQDLTLILQQGLAAAQTVLLTTAGLAGGQSRWALIQATFSQADAIRPTDPNGGLLFFYNAANPAQPFQGPGNDLATTPTVRQGICQISVIYGSVATTGSEVPPAASANNVGLYLVDLAFGQTTVVNGQILVAGPSVGTGVPGNYPVAPFLAGLLQSHHNGNPGQAPQIKLGSEVQGVLPSPNLGPLASQVVGSFRDLAGSSAGGVVTATWAAKELVAATALGGVEYKGASLSLSFNGAGTGANGMDTGSFPSGADLSIYAIYNPTSNLWRTLGCLGATSNGPVYSGIHLPAGYTASTKIWSGVTNSSQFRQFQQYGRTIWLPPVNALNGSVSNTTNVSASMTNIVPADATSFFGQLSITSSVSNTVFMSADNGNALGLQTVGSTIISSGNNGNFGPMPLPTPQTFWYLIAGSTATVQIAVTGYMF